VHADIQLANLHAVAPDAGEKMAQSLRQGNAPRAESPTSTTSLPASFRSAISWAIRVNARWMAGAFKITVLSGMSSSRPARQHPTLSPGADVSEVQPNKLWIQNAEI
jgi:hypothetical protein